VCAAVALEVLDIYEQDRVFENVLALEPHLASRLRELLELPLVGDVRGAGFFWAMELVHDGDLPFDVAERERLLRGFLPGRLLEAGLIARADDRGDAVLQIAPPLIADRALLDDLVDRLADVLDDAGRHMGL
jgi:adenosylmethionine-8-amino-7-oxononanoate aminotransferase